jgi:16S rRNA (cytosine1402-N4)-methyltransferase
MSIVAGMRIFPATPGGSTRNALGHQPVLLHPLIQSLQPKPGDTVVDGTFGAGGVTAALLERVMPGGRVIAIDRDGEAIQRGQRKFMAHAQWITFVHDDFANLELILKKLSIDFVNAVALDIGISSLQLDDPARGFSFQNDGPLDMRFDINVQSRTAAHIVNEWPEAELSNLLSVYGEESFASAIARHIVRMRQQQPFSTTKQLRLCVEQAIPRRHWPKRIHPATKTFQALRIEVNGELQSLEQGLQASIRVLRPGGRLGVIAFHSLEDTLVKNTLHVAAQNCLCPPQQPLCTCAHRASLFLVTRKPIRPDDVEIAANPRARSARLRVAERITS